jgi:hypothetical protein
MPDLHLSANQRRWATARPERRECAPRPGRRPITQRETKRPALRIPIAESGRLMAEPNDHAGGRRSSFYDALTSRSPGAAESGSAP